MLLQLMGDFHLNASSSINERLLFDKSSNDTKGIMEGAVGLFQDQLVGATDQDGHGVTGVLHTRHLDHLYMSVWREGNERTMKMRTIFV